MARYLSRDFNIQVNSGAASSEAQAYLFAIFVRRILGYTHVGHTNFNIETVGTLLLASGTGAGNRAGINFGAGAVYEVSVPSGIRTVAVGDIGRILVLKSTANPLHNAGLFLITGVNTTDNRYIIDYRSGDAPPAEAADSMDWWLYAADSVRPASGSTNAATNLYRGNGASTTPRLILQSPHATAWQVRICVETSTDYGIAGLWTAVPGYNGDANGDFPVGGRNLHGGIFWNTSISQSTSGVATPGAGAQAATVWRVTMTGDDTGQALVFAGRRTSGGANHTLLVLGIPDNEPSPLPSTDPMHRLFVYGSGHSGNSGQWLNNISFFVGPWATNGGLGLAWGLGGAHVACTPSCWSYVYGGNPFADATAGDSPWNSSTELFTVEVVTGAVYNWSHNLGTLPSGTTQIQMLPEVRSLGTLPWLRHGRTNFGGFTLTTDAGKAWQHLANGVYLQWGGPAVIV